MEKLMLSRRTLLAVALSIGTLGAAADAFAQGVDPRPPNAPTQKPAFAGQARAPGDEHLAHAPRRDAREQLVGAHAQPPGGEPGRYQVRR